MRPRLVTLAPVKFGRWTVQASVFDNDSICVIANLDNNLRCFVRFFEDEDKASVWIRSIVNKRDSMFAGSDRGT